MRAVARSTCAESLEEPQRATETHVSQAAIPVDPDLCDRCVPISPNASLSGKHGFAVERSHKVSLRPPPGA
jgi:hypothetical protein